MPNGSDADVVAAIDAASAAFEGWRSTAASIEHGCCALRRPRPKRKEEIAAVMTAEQGKPLTEALGEVRYAASFLEWFGGEAERVYGQVVPPMNPVNRVLVIRQPVGVAVAITPAGGDDDAQAPVRRSLAARVVKPASATPLTAALILRAIEDAGAPPGVVNLVSSRSLNGGEHDLRR